MLNKIIITATGQFGLVTDETKNTVTIDDQHTRMKSNVTLWQPKQGELVLIETPSGTYILSKYNDAVKQASSSFKIQPYQGPIPFKFKDTQ